MAYIPPHRRHSKDSEKPPPTPEMFASKFNTRLDLRSTKQPLPFADLSIRRWCAVDSDGSIRPGFNCHDKLEAISHESIRLKKGKTPLILVNTSVAKDNDDMRGNIAKSPWESIAQNVWQDLLSYENVRKEMQSQQLEEVKPGLFARFGKNIFFQYVSPFSRLFYTNLPTSYMEKITSEVVPKIGVDFHMEKQVYHVLVSDSTRSGLVISCKCRIKEEEKLELYKVELNPIRHMVVDMSCLDKNLDLRLSLISKRILTALPDDEMDSLRNVVNSAVIDPNVVGGLRWPLGRTYNWNRYLVVEAWCTKVKIYQSPSLRLRIRHVEYFDFKTNTGEVTIEVVLRLKRVLSQLPEKKVDTDMVYGDRFSDP